MPIESTDPLPDLDRERIPLRPVGSRPFGHRRRPAGAGEAAVGSAVSASIVALLVLVGCARMDDSVDAPIDWSIVDGDPDDSACGLPSGDQAVPASSPAATWDDVDGVSIPTSSSIGPGRTDGWHTCYAHSPTGALFAAASLVADERMHGNWALIDDRAAFTEQVVEAISSDTLPDRSGFPTDPAPQLVGYRFSSVSEDDVALQLAWSSPTIEDAAWQLSTSEVQVTWTENDWKAVMQASGTAWTAVQTIDDLDGLVRWSSDLP
ncbi:MAG TPA: hypothetical protein VGC67_15045 [Cellulomonas sp.]